MLAARLGRAKDNYLETLPAFLALALVAIARNGEAVLALAGARTYLIARLLYIPAYASGVILLRSLVWLASIAGLMMMAAAALAAI